MSSRDYPLYYQGALLDPDVFDAARLIQFLLEENEIDIGDVAMEDLKNGQFSTELQLALCEAFDMDDGEFESLNEFRDELLTYKTEVFETLEQAFIDAHGVSYHHLTGIVADFYFSQSNNSEALEEASFLAFTTPLAWEPKASDRPSSFEEAVSWLNNAGKKVFQNGIDWKPKLGELLGTVWG